MYSRQTKTSFFSSYVYLHGFTQICARGHNVHAPPGFNRVNAEACLFGLIWPSKSLIKDYFRICWRKKDHLQLTLRLALASNFWRWLRARFHTVHLEFIIIFILWHHCTANIIFILWHQCTANIIFLLRHQCTAKIIFILWHQCNANIIFILWHHYTANIIFLHRHHCTANIIFILWHHYTANIIFLRRSVR